MEVTDIKIYPVGEDKLRAFVSIVLDHCFRISDIKIIQGSQGRFLSMPSKRRKDGSYRDIAHPLNSEMRQYLEETIFRKFDELAGDGALDQASWEERDVEQKQAGPREEPPRLAAEAAEGEGGHQDQQLMT